MSTASNPQIAVITYMEKKILEAFTKGEYVLVLRQLLLLINLMRASHRDTELVEKISAEYNNLMGNTESKRATYSQKKSLTYISWFGETMQKLYIHGYLIDQGYEMTYPAELPKNGAYVSPLLQVDP